MTTLDPPVFDECLSHLDVFAALRHRPQQRHRGDVIGRLSLLFSQFGHDTCAASTRPCIAVSMDGAAPPLPNAQKSNAATISSSRSTPG